MVANKELSDKDYVSLKAAKALKSIGYNIPTHTHYHIRDDRVSVSVSSNPEYWTDYDNGIDRPILQKAKEYIRDVRYISLRINLSLLKGKWFYDFLDLVDGSYLDSDDYYDDYNKAVNAGICEICNYIKMDSRTLKKETMNTSERKTFKGKALYKPTGKAGEYSEWACNFFTGCSNNCSYCFCKRGVFSHVWTDTPKLKKCFRDFDHAISIFEKEMMANICELRKTGIFFSFTTDPMLPGKTLELTLRAAELALKNDVPVQILTKCADWWDTGVWMETAKPVFVDYADKVAIGFTLTGRDDLEPGASPHRERIATMRLCANWGFHTFASIEPIVDLEFSDNVMEKAMPYCHLFKVGLMSGGAKPDRDDLKRMVDKWNHILDKRGQKVYWKQSIVDYLGDDFTFWLDSCVNADYNIFESR